MRYLLVSFTFFDRCLVWEAFQKVPRGCGYAGGIGPGNIDAILRAVADAVGPERDVWIDMESSLRTKTASSGANPGDCEDVFDLGKCEECIAKCLATGLVASLQLAPAPPRGLPCARSVLESSSFELTSTSPAP